MFAVSDDRDIQREGRRLTALLNFASDQAALQGREFGVRFSQTEYGFYDLDPDTNAWIELTGDPHLRPRALPEGSDFEFTLWVEDREMELDVGLNDYRRDSDERDTDDDGNPTVEVAPAPHVVILSSGETTPFVLRLGDPYADQEVAISADAWAGYEFHANADDIE